MRIRIEEDLDYVMGYLRYGHREGIIDIPDEDFEQFKKDPMDYLERFDLYDKCDIVIDDWSIDDYGSPMNLEWEVLPEPQVNPILHACGLESRPRWIPSGEYSICSNCGAHSGTQSDGVELVPLETPYCPYCGQKMIESI